MTERLPIDKVARSTPPRLDPDNAEYFAAAAAGRLIIQRCTDCGLPRYYPRLLCPDCHSEASDWMQASGLGTVHSYSVVWRAPLPQFADMVPYIVALVDLDEGVRMFTRVDAPHDDIRIGDRVTCRIEKMSEDIGIPVFVPHLKEKPE